MSLGEFSGLPSWRSTTVGDRAVVLRPRHPSRTVLAGQEPALTVSRVAIREVRGLAKYAGHAGLFVPAHDPVVRNVAPEQVSSVAEPRRPFGPSKPRREALDLGQVEPIAGEALVDDLDGGIRIPLARLPLGECARRRGQSGRHRSRRQERPSGHGHGLPPRGEGWWQGYVHGAGHLSRDRLEVSIPPMSSRPSGPVLPLLDIIHLIGSTPECLSCLPASPFRCCALRCAATC